jgi:O-antigen/teichoic acid export membrane protein
MTSRVVTHIRTPLYKNSYALVVSAGGTAVLGLLYWTIAARRYSPHEVGVQSVVISTMLFLSGLSQLSLNSVLIRFLPVARRGTGRMIGGAYIVSAVAAVVVAAVFVLGTPFWSPTLSFLRSDALWFGAFVAGTAVWCVFTLQDSVLAGLRRATWVPIENIGVSIAKIALLLLFASRLPRAGLFASWVIPAVVAVGIVTTLIVRIVLPPMRRQESPEPHRLGEIVRFAIGNHVGFVFYAASSNLLPLVVLNEVGAAQAAFFFLPWTIASAVAAIAASTATSLTVETARDLDRLRSYCRRTLVQTFALLLPVVALLVVGAPTLLRLFGEDYAAEGSTALRLLALGLLPSALVTVGLGVLRLKGLVVRLAALQAFICVSLLGVSYYLLSRHGIDGAAVGFVLSQGVAAVVLLLTDLRPIVVSRAGATIP